MPKYAERKLVPYRPDQMFDLVADVGKYPQFLPWCIGARIRSQQGNELVADLTIGFGPFRESFTSRVLLDLHGMTVARAHPAVIALIEGAAARGERCVEIVTGSGARSADGFQGVLRRDVPRWLNEPGLRERILALSHPHPNNPGAIRVLIRRQRPG